MNYEVFLEHVQRRADLSRSEAMTVCASALETLGELLDETQRDQLAAQLPVELVPLLKRRSTDRVGLEEFYNRVRARADVSTAKAVDYARAVALTLKEALSPELMSAALAWLPEEYKELFGSSEAGPESPTTMGS